MTKNNHSGITEQLEAMVALAEELAQSRNSEDSIELYEQVIEILKKVEIDRDYLANLMTQKIDRYMNYYDVKEYKKAIQELNQILKMPLPQSLISEMQISRSLCYLHLGQLEKALDDCQGIIEIDPNYSYAYYAQGVMNNAQKDYNSAVASFTTAVEMPFKTGRSMNKNLAINCWIEKAICEAKLGFLQDAMQSLSMGQIIGPDNSKIYYTRGLILEEFIESEEDIKEALEQYIYALQIDSTYINAYLRIGNLCSKSENYQTAISAYESVIEIDPNSEEAYKNRGLLYQKLGQYRDAVADYNQILRINDNNAEIYYQRGIIYELLGKQKLAMLDFEKVNELDEYSNYYSNFNNEDENYELFSYFFPKDIKPIQAINLIKKFTVFCEQKQKIPYFSKFFGIESSIINACIFDKYQQEKIPILDIIRECYDDDYKPPFYFGSDFEIFFIHGDEYSYNYSYNTFLIFNEFGLVSKNCAKIPDFIFPHGLTVDISLINNHFEKTFWNPCNYESLAITEKDDKLFIVIQPNETYYLLFTNMKDDDTFLEREHKKAVLMFIYFLIKKYFKIYKECVDLPVIRYRHDSVSCLFLETDEQTSFETMIELLDTTDITVADFDTLLKDKLRRINS